MPADYLPDWEWKKAAEVEDDEGYVNWSGGPDAYSNSLEGTDAD